MGAYPGVGACPGHYGMYKREGVHVCNYRVYKCKNVYNLYNVCEKRCIRVCKLLCMDTISSVKRLAYVSEVLEELVANSLVLDTSCVVLVVVALHREVPVEVAGQLRATTRTSNKEASQVGELVVGGGGENS